ncbi:SusC/RagA family TonB-linked outer membrane protein [Lacibacter sp. H375]|uniref:SusC/RagA family TonB-linked outer membrane protein n=1 Tax=Lacibacter sp. H375 TaxID=3133424 RepID=UPI0030BCA28B
MRKFVLLISLLLCSLHMMAQEKTVTGKVTDEKDGSTLSGVSVIVKGTSVGTTTGADGTFKLNVPTSAKTLVITLLDYENLEVAIGNRSTFNLALTSTSKSLSEVVVVAYGTTKKEAFTGSVGSIKAADIEKRPLGNVVKSIEGAIPGVVTTSGSGQPGNSNAIRIRGFGSISATQDPLFVIDGVPYVGGSSNINPDDVENITVLKDASATALYGSRAGNGVVMITTKKGKKGKNSISVKIAQGFSQRGLQEYDRVGPNEYYPVMWEAYRNSLVYRASGAISLDSANRVASGLTSRNGISDLLAYNPFNVARNQIVGVDGKLNANAQLLYADDLDWTKELMRNGVRKDYGINFSGGTDKADYFLSMGYLKEDGYTIQTDFERYSIRLNTNVRPLEWLKTGLNVTSNYSKFNTSSDGGGIVNPFTFTRNLGPIYPYYAHNMTTGQYVLDAGGNRIWDLGNFQNEAIGIQNGIRNRPGTTSGRHAPAELILNDYLSTRWVIGARSNTEITLFRDFKFTNNVAVDFQTDNDGTFENTLVGDGAPAGRLQKSSGSTVGLTANQLLGYGRKFGNHRVDALVGHETFNQFSTGLNGFRQGQSLTGINEFGNFTTINSLGSSTDRYRIESYFSRINYDFDGRYLLTASLRRDGNSRFASESRWGTFWALGGGWNVSRESFMSGIKWIDNLKLRGSYGLVGVADGIGLYAWQGLYGFANNANESGIVQSQTQVENRDLTWEINTQADIGVEFSLFKSRLSGTIEYYDRRSSDLLFAVPTPLSSGLLSATKNTATMYNKGLELQLNGDIIRTKDFTWSLGVNLTTVKNRITKMPESVKEFVSGTKKYQVGASLFDYWLRSYYGVDPSDGSVLYWAGNTTASSGIRLIDNKDGGKDTVTTLVANGKFAYHEGVIPDLYGSFAPAFRYKGFTLQALFTFQVGGKTYDANYQTLMSSGTYGSAVHVDILKRWQKPGDITNVPRMDNGQTADFNATSSRWLIDASYLNIRTLNLSYQFPNELLSRAKISGAQCYISLENVAFFSKRVGMNNQNAFSGITGGEYPPARIITAGITFTLN